MKVQTSCTYQLTSVELSSVTRALTAVRNGTSMKFVQDEIDEVLPLLRAGKPLTGKQSEIFRVSMCRYLKDKYGDDMLEWKGVAGEIGRTLQGL